MAKATIVFIPGAWHTPDAFQPVMKILETAGYQTVPISLPSNGADPAKPNMDDDTTAVRDVVAPIVESGKDVVCVAHSYGSLPMCDALKGLGREERHEAGKGGGVTRLVYLAAFVVDEGGTVLEALGGKDLPWFNTNLETGIVTPDNPRQVFYGDLSDEEAQEWIDRLQTFSYGCWKSKVEYAAFKHIPSTYLMCEDDQALLLPVQEGMMQAAAGKFAVERCKSSHSPFLSNVEFTAEVIERAAGGPKIRALSLTGE